MWNMLDKPMLNLYSFFFKWSLYLNPVVSPQLYANESISDHVGFARVFIDLINENDNRPIFSRPLYNITLPENTPLGTSMLRILVSILGNHCTVCTAHSSECEKLLYYLYYLLLKRHLTRIQIDFKCITINLTCTSNWYGSFCIGNKV